MPKTFAQWYTFRLAVKIKHTLWISKKKKIVTDTKWSTFSHEAGKFWNRLWTSRTQPKKLSVVDICCTYNKPSIFLVLHKGVMKPDELFMLSHHRELVLLEVGKSALENQDQKKIWSVTFSSQKDHLSSEKSKLYNI